MGSRLDVDSTACRRCFVEGDVPFDCNGTVRGVGGEWDFQGREKGIQEKEKRRQGKGLDG